MARLGRVAKFGHDFPEVGSPAAGIRSDRQVQRVQAIPGQAPAGAGDGAIERLLALIDRVPSVLADRDVRRVRGQPELTR